MNHPAQAKAGDLEWSLVCFSVRTQDFVAADEEVLWPTRFFGQTGAARSLFSPQIETFQRGDQFVVRADLPGLHKEDVNIDITDDSVTIRRRRRTRA